MPLIGCPAHPLRFPCNRSAKFELPPIRYRALRADDLAVRSCWASVHLIPARLSGGFCGPSKPEPIGSIILVSRRGGGCRVHPLSVGPRWRPLGGRRPFPFRFDCTIFIRATPGWRSQFAPQAAETGCRLLRAARRFRRRANRGIVFVSRRGGGRVRLGPAGPHHPTLSAPALPPHPRPSTERA
jgi:hypothetical protein